MLGGILMEEDEDWMVENVLFMKVLGSISGVILGLTFLATIKW
jgi:hypothetical protein